MPLSFELDADDKLVLANLARLSIESCLNGHEVPLPEVKSPVLNRDLGSFVTLNKENVLRGCIGSIVGHEPLYINVWRMARAAAFNDPRFPPLKAGEWSSVSLHISVLDVLSPCPDPEAIEVGKHGLALQLGARSGVFLPQVPVEQGWNRLDYLEHLCDKAGVPHGSWRRPDAKLFWYEAVVFVG